MTMSEKENNKNDGFSKGIVLIIIGVIALLITFFEVAVDWHVVGKMWPVLLIAIGIGIMPINRWIRTVLILVLLALGYVAYQNKTDGTTKVINKTVIISTYDDENED